MGRDFGAKDNVRIVLKPIVFQRCVNCRSIGTHRAAWCDIGLYKRHDFIDSGRGNALKANAPKTLGLKHFNGNSNGYQMAAVMGF